MCGFQLSTFNIFLNGNGLSPCRINTKSKHHIRRDPSPRPRVSVSRRHAAYLSGAGLLRSELAVLGRDWAWSLGLVHRSKERVVVTPRRPIPQCSRRRGNCPFRVRREGRPRSALPSRGQQRAECRGIAALWQRHQVLRRLLLLLLLLLCF